MHFYHQHFVLAFRFFIKLKSGVVILFFSILFYYSVYPTTLLPKRMRGARQSTIFTKFTFLFIYCIYFFIHLLWHAKGTEILTL